MKNDMKNYTLGNQPSKKSKFNALDIVIILAILLIVATCVYRSVNIKGVSDELKDYQIQFKIEKIRASSKDILDKDEDMVVRFTNSGEVIGTLGKYEYFGLAIAKYGEGGLPLYYPEDEDNPGNTIYEYNGSINVKGTFSAVNGFMLNGKTYIAPNSTFSISTEHIETVITVTAINAK